MSFTLTELKLPSGTIPCHVGGKGNPLLCLHSGGGVRLSPALEQLAESHRLYLPVFPGFDGTKFDPRRTSMASLADLAAEIMDAAIGPSCDVLGHSFGGWVACWLAAKHPGRVQQLVLVAPAGFIPEGQGGLPDDPVRLRQMMFAHPEKMPPEQKPAAVMAGNRAAIGHYCAAGTDRDLLAQLGQVTALTLVLHGTKDGIIPLASPQLLKERIPHAHLVYLYDAAHAIDVDQPHAFARLVGDFLTRGESFIVNNGASAA